jgi:hypothetical protein
MIPARKGVRDVIAVDSLRYWRLVENQARKRKTAKAQKNAEKNAALSI